MSGITISYLKECVTLCRETGSLTWRERPRNHFKSDVEWKKWNTRHAGNPAMCTQNARGYLVGMLDKKNMLAHRVVWALRHGEWPNVVDHINRDKSDNRPENLRNVDHLRNRLNRRLERRNTSGCTGVYWNKQRQKWHAQIKRGDIRVHICFSSNLEEAIKARKAAEKKLDLGLIG